MPPLKPRLAWARDTGLGASVIRIMTTLVNAHERRGDGCGLQTMREGGGMVNATVIERFG